MKKICFVTTIHATLDAFVVPTARYLHDSGQYQIYFVCNPDEKFEKSLPDFINFCPVKMERGISLSGIRSTLDFVRLFKKEKFDYIQYSTPNASLYASIAAWIARSPIRLYAQWGIRYVGAGGMGRRVLKTLEKISCRLSTHIRSVSKMNMQFGIDEGLCRADKVSVIGNGGTIGVSLEEFNIDNKDVGRDIIRKKYDIPSDAVVFGFIGRLCRDKGSAELLSAFKRLYCENDNVYLMLIGQNEGIEGIDEELLNWSANCDRVIYTGPIKKSELGPYYANFDCYVHPTYREGFGMVLQEAGAMGCAIITTDIPGASEVMENNVSCKLVSPRDDNELYNAMEYMLQNPEELKKMGEEAYVRTCKLYKREIMLENIKNDIMKVLGE